MAEQFDYSSAFQINSSIFSTDEQDILRNARVTIAGIGGIGGTMAIILARSGITNFTLFDPDIYEESNSNRQIGCFVDTLGRYKSEVIKGEILRINPEADVEAYTRKLSFDELGELIDRSDVIIPAADDFAFSSKVIIMAEKQKKCAIAVMPSGLTGYVMVFPPNLSSIIDPADLFGAPRNLPYEELYRFLENPLNKCGRRWYITQGKWRIEWFNKWRANEVRLAQICPNVWLGASLACIEVLKYLTGKWEPVTAPKMWHLMTAENLIKVARFRRRTWFFCKFIVWAFNIKWMGIGQGVRNFTSKRNQRELAEMEKQERDGKEIKPPFMWRHLI